MIYTMMYGSTNIKFFKMFPSQTVLTFGKLILRHTVSENFHSLNEQTVKY